MTSKGLRIVAGRFGGRRIRSAPNSRPTQERVREALFSRWHQLLEGVLFVDLFCGGGAVGFEALSRGAQHCLFVDASARSLEVTRVNAKDLGVEEQCTQHRAELPQQWAQALTFIERSETDRLVFADPPYDFGGYDVLATSVSTVNRLGAAAIEHSSRSEWVSSGWEETRRYGESAVTFF